LHERVNGRPTERLGQLFRTHLFIARLKCDVMVVLVVVVVLVGLLVMVVVPEAVVGHLE